MTQDNFKDFLSIEWEYNEPEITTIFCIWVMNNDEPDMDELSELLGLNHVSICSE